MVYYSLSFEGNLTSYLKFPGLTDISFGTGDFTIEWYQYQTDNNSHPRPFDTGDWSLSNMVFGVSIEGGSFYFWNYPQTIAFGHYISPSNYKNKWVHFAICRKSGQTTFYFNGINQYSYNDTNVYSHGVDTSPAYSNVLTIGNDGALSDPESAYGGLIFGFSIENGRSHYNGNFTPTGLPPPVTSYTSIMLYGEDNRLVIYGNYSGSVYNALTFSTNIPSHFPPPPPPPGPTLPVLKRPFIGFGNPVHMPTSKTLPNIPKMDMSLFSNNSLVCYKTHSLPSSGAGTVRNSRKIGQKT
jgi:hypothetical protein